MSSPFEQFDARLRRLPDVVTFFLGMALVAAIAAFK